MVERKSTTTQSRRNSPEDAEKSSTGDPEVHSAKLRHSSYTVGWICALSKEQAAAFGMLDKNHPSLPKPPHDHNTYTLGSIGAHNIVIACLPKGRYGTCSASRVAAWMTSTFPSLRVGLMVGIGGGIPPKVRLGDVVVSSPEGEFPGVVQWDMGKAGQSGQFKRTGALNNPPSALLTALSKIETSHVTHDSKISLYLDDLAKRFPKMKSQYTWSPYLKDPLTTEEGLSFLKLKSTVVSLLGIVWKFLLGLLGYLVGGQSLSSPQGSPSEHLASTVDAESSRARRKPGEVRVHYGLIASGNKVIKDVQLRDLINRSLDNSVLCIEMEAAGLMNDFPCIVIRGICDYADSKKNDSWQEYAAAVAAAYAKELLEYLPPGDIEKERTLKEISDALSRTEAKVEDVKFTLSRKEDHEVLDWLMPLSYGHQQSQSLNLRQSGTGQWFLSSPQYQHWLESSNQTLFCPGMPGAGKTILTATVIDDLMKKFTQNLNFGIAYIYFNYSRKGEQSIEILAASLLKQLSVSRPSLPEGLTDLYEKHKNKQTRPSFYEIQKILISVITGYHTVFIVVDALDECQEESSNCRSRFIAEIFHLQKQANINIFATSRDYLQITEKFQDGLKIDIRAHDEDVRSYLREKIQHSNSPTLASHSDEIEKQIIAAVGGMFLLARLYFESIRNKTTARKLRDALKDLPRGYQAYDDAYRRAMQRIKDQDQDCEELAMRALSWIVCAKRQLTIDELGHGLAVEAGDTDLWEDNIPQLRDIISVCAGLVTVEEGPSSRPDRWWPEGERNVPKVVRLVHFTTQEYFERTWRDWFPDAEGYLTQSCACYLSFRSLENERYLAGNKSQTHQFSDRYKLYDYCARNWGHHARASSTICPAVLKFLDSRVGVELSSHPLTDSSGFLVQNRRPRSTGLHLAAYFGLEEVVKKLTEESFRVNGNCKDLDLEDLTGQRPLSWAARNGHAAVVKQLLELGATQHSTESAVGDELLGYYTYRDGRSPLALAAYHGHVAVVKVLIEKKADLESKDLYERSPLSLAAAQGHEAVVKLLVQNKAYLESKDRDGKTPLLLAVGGNMAKWLNSY
ncbi:hypothetical protein N7456_002598 [Penicillium angulare]|uniref:Nucleoside phosphorylase domain-containing protein n=1 Tax=Penicillium angulare TaxID=116970 RepID=A0A9W9G8S7_9EURO|nr:hypothetical protein N7456_002598 [Penicillium angulare]